MSQTIMEKGLKNSGLKSAPSRDRSFLKFCNRSTRTVDLKWLDYEGVGVKYRTLSPNDTVDVNTFVGHYWKVEDNSTGDKLIVNNQYVLNPPLFRIIQGCYSPSSRAICNITIPIYALQDRCLQVLRWCIPKDRVKYLRIPRLLQIDLSEYISAISVSLAYCNTGNSIIPNPNFQDLRSPSQSYPSLSDLAIPGTSCSSPETENNKESLGVKESEADQDKNTSD